jgi:DNA polymerase III delta prime subunit
MFSKEHHAQFISNKKEEVWGDLQKFISEELGVTILGNPNVLVFDTETFGIDDSRLLKSFQSVKAFGIQTEKIAILSFFSITREAQNALLKLFEEPTGDTKFFVMAPSTELLLPTLLSRFQVVNLHLEKKHKYDGRKFLKSNIAERISIINPIIDNKDKEQAIDFLNSIEVALYELGKKNNTINYCFEDILSAKKELRGRSPSIKMLLEHIAHILPVVE